VSGGFLTKVDPHNLEFFHPGQVHFRAVSQLKFEANRSRGSLVMIGHPNKDTNRHYYLYINLACLFVCIKLTSKRLKRSGPKFCGTLRDPREGMIEFSKISL